MADIELVIKMPEKLACEGFDRPFTEEEKSVLIRAIGNGIPLPKGHGRLIDADELDIKTIAIVLKDDIENALTIIEADKTEKE